MIPEIDQCFFTLLYTTIKHLHCSMGVILNLCLTAYNPVFFTVVAYQLFQKSLICSNAFMITKTHKWMYKNNIMRGLQLFFAGLFEAELRSQRIENHVQVQHDNSNSWAWWPSWPRTPAHPPCRGVKRGKLVAEEQRWGPASGTWRSC